MSENAPPGDAFFLQRDDVTLHGYSLGRGPLVLLVHGFPGLAYSWRHQLPALAEAGYRAVALDMRGYGRSSRPVNVASYSYDHLAADLLAVMDHFDAPTAVLVGHDFGANLAWHMAIHHPGRITAIVALASPYDLPLAGGCDVLPSQLYAEIASQHFFHMDYFQPPGRAEADLRGREREFLTRLFWALSARGDLLDWQRFPTRGTQYLDVLAEPETELPWDWLSVEDMDHYVAEYLRSGPELAFAGGINSYRVMDLNWQRFRDTAHAEIPIPALFLAGAEDPVIKLCEPEVLQDMRRKVPDLRGLELVPGAGHFVQQEKVDVTNRALLDFLRGL